jgi:hypothetical protein
MEAAHGCHAQVDAGKRKVSGHKREFHNENRFAY